MARASVTRAAGALRRHAARSVQRHGARSIEAVVESLAPLTLDPAGMDAILTDDDVTIGRALERHFDDEPLAVGDTLVLVETEPGDYTAVDVLPA